MNLVQINERLKDLPMQVIQQYANGMNPEVPPYLALGELQRRESSQKQAATAQGGQQGPQPSIKEQIEQKSGLMALQQMQQQQMAQQQQQPQGPMPVPAGAPQPEMQPQPEMMARGGLAGIPVRRDMFEYAGGGIIAFAEGGQSKKPLDATAKEALEEAQRSGDRSAMMGTIKKLAAAGYDIATLIPRAAMGVAEDLSNTRLGRALGVDFEIPQAAYGGDRASMTPMLDRVQREETQVREPMVTSQGPGMPVVPRRPIEASGLQEALKNATPAADLARPPATPAATARPAAPMAGAQMPSAPRPTPAQAGAPQSGLPAAAQDRSPYFAQMDADLAKPIAAPTPEGIIAQQKALSPESMQEAALQKRNQEMRDRATSYKEQFEKSRPSGLDDLIRVFGQAGQYKGLSGMAPAYTANKQQQRAEELAMTKQYNELMNLADTKELEGGKELFGARSKSMDAANNAYQNQLMTRTKSLADMAGVDQRRMDEAANRLTNVQLEKMRIAARAAEASRPGEAERIEARYMGMVAKGQIKEANEYLERISKIKGGGSGGDRGPTPTDRLRAAQSIMNDIDSTTEEKAMAKKEIAGIMSGAQAGGAGTPKVMSQADVLATAKSSGKTPQQVIEAAKARGYTIQ